MADRKPERIPRQLTAPVSSSKEPALAAKASGMSSRDGGMLVRTATRTTAGISAATAPLMLISAVSAATSSMVYTSNRVWLPPAHRA